MSGADPIEVRPGFGDMLKLIASNGVRTIIVETALIVQETGHRMLKGKGIDIIAADSPAAFVDDTPTPTFVGQVLGAVAELGASFMGPVNPQDHGPRPRKLGGVTAGCKPNLWLPRLALARLWEAGARGDQTA